VCPFVISVRDEIEKDPSSLQLTENEKLKNNIGQLIDAWERQFSSSEGWKSPEEINTQIGIVMFKTAIFGNPEFNLNLSRVAPENAIVACETFRKHHGESCISMTRSMPSRFSLLN